MRSNIGTLCFTVARLGRSCDGSLSRLRRRRRVSHGRGGLGLVSRLDTKDWFFWKFPHEGVMDGF
jgi:hypothetical protein